MNYSGCTYIRQFEACIMSYTWTTQCQKVNFSTLKRKCYIVKMAENNYIKEYKECMNVNHLSKLSKLMANANAYKI